MSNQKTNHNQHVIAYFSMEIGIESGLPTYSGGLGVLAGDTIRSAADLRVPMIAVTLLHRKGYFYQRLEPGGWQREEPVAWIVEDYLEEMPQRAQVTIQGRPVHIRAWKYTVTGVTGAAVPVYFLDADLPENSDYDRSLTGYLYGGDKLYRLCQEVVLGIGGVRMLKALGYESVGRYHMNEGHAALLTAELLADQLAASGHPVADDQDIAAVRELCVFTTHTPVPSGHDKFTFDMVQSVLGKHPVLANHDIVCCEDLFNMTYLALNLGGYVNGVAKKHGEVSRLMFARYEIDSITNGVHAATWTSEPIRRLLDKYVPDWRKDNFSLRYALNIPTDELWLAHMQAKRALIQIVNRQTNAGMDVDHLTLGFARRAATYKRADLLFHDLEQLRKVAAGVPLQIIYAGKAHPQDNDGKELIKRIIQARDALRGAVRVAYLPNYDMELGAMMTGGVDVWLNTPQPPMEASGTSGMKAALNGVPSLSILDGWWIEGCIEGLTGWAIGSKDAEAGAAERARDAASLYEKLQRVVIPLFYENREGLVDMMRHCIGLNGSFFNTQRMMQQYVLNAYFR